MQSATQFSEQCLWWEQFGTSCCQFDSQWQPIEPETDLGDSCYIVRRELKIRSDGPCPLKKQVYRWNVCEQFCIWEVLEIWERKGMDDELVLAT
jgi:hypothetical protein